MRNDHICGYGLTPYDIITFVYLCHVCHISNGFVFGTEQKLREFKILALTCVSIIDNLNSPF